GPYRFGFGSENRACSFEERLGRKSKPEPGGIVRSCSEKLAVRVKGDGPHGAAVLHRLADRVPRVSVPEARRVVPRCASEKPASAIEDNGRDRAGVLHRFADSRASAGVPQLRRIAGRSGSQKTACWLERQGQHVADVPHWAPYRIAGPRVPELRRVVLPLGSGSKQSAGGIQCYGLDCAMVLHRFTKRCPGVGIPEPGGVL